MEIEKSYNSIKSELDHVVMCRDTAFRDFRLEISEKSSNIEILNNDKAELSGLVDTLKGDILCLNKELEEKTLQLSDEQAKNLRLYKEVLVIFFNIISRISKMRVMLLL